VVVDKPAGWTSHQVVGRVRRLAGTRRVGHAGTLDPMATGVLLVGINRATRLLGHLSLTDKAYQATVRLGLTTVTDDAEGDVVDAPGAAWVSETEIHAQMATLRGDLRQVPSAVSAIKVDGVRSYARVRSGEQVALAPRPVHVARFAGTGVRPGVVDGVAVLDVDVEVECSSGTYVRALARDLGAALGTGGHLAALRRTRVGPFTLAEAHPLESAAAGLPLLGLADVACRCFPTRSLTPDEAAAVRHGRRLSGLGLAESPTALLGPDGELLALYGPAGDDAVAIAVFVG